MNGDDDIRKTQGRGLSQPLTQGPPQSSRSVASKGTRAPSPPPPQPGRSRSLSLQELHDILAKLLISLKRKTQLSVLGFKTIAIGLVEGIDENGVAFQTLVYTDRKSTRLNSSH